MFGSSTGGSGFGGFGQQNNQQSGQTGGLFGQSQPAQTNTPSFGGFGSAQNQQMPAFGSSTTNTGAGGLFGQTQQQQPSSGFSFGQNTNTPTQPFGQSAQTNQPKPAGFGGFGSSTAGTSSGFGGFGANQAQQPAFGSSTAGTNAFGAKPAGGGLFGQQPQQASGAFGQPAATGSLFGGGGNNNLSAQQTGGMPTQGTSVPTYQPFPSTEKDANGTSSTTYQYNTITCMPAYRAASVEELRLQDYQQGRKTGNAGPSTGGFGQPATNNAFGAGNTGGSLFGGQAQQSTGGFGASTTGGGLFGQNNQQPQQQSGGLFGSSTNTNTAGGGLFGQPAQQQGGLFGQNNQQQQQQGSTGFTFGQSQPANNAGSSGFTFGQNNQQQNKPGGLFGGGSTGGFGSTTTQPASSGFSFGGNTAAQQPQTGGFGGAAASSGGFGFGASTTANQSKPGGLFGATTTAPSFGGFGATSTSNATDANKPAFSFGGGAGGFGSTSAAPGQTTTAAPTGGLFGSQQNTAAGQPSTGFSFGAAGANNNQGGLGGGTSSSFSFGGTQPQQQQQGNTTTGFGSNTSLFGQNKPATGGLFGSTQPQQQQTGAFSFGGANNASSGQTAGGGLFGAGAKPATGGLFGSSTTGATQPGQSGGLFGSSTLGSGQQTAGATGGLFGSGQNASGGLFGNNQNTNAASGAGGLFGGSSTLGGGTSFGGAQSTGSLFGQSQMNQSLGSNLQTSLNANPYGTDSLFGGAAASLTGSLSSNPDARAGLSNSQVMLPFNVAKPSVKKQPPLVPPFRPSPRASTRITKLRGSTPGSGFRESTPVREGTPSLFASANATNRTIASPSAGSQLFRGLSDDVARSQREASVPTSLPSQAFVGRSSVKRLVLDDQTNKSVNASNLHGRSRSLFGGARGSSAAPEQNNTIQSTSLFDRSTTAATSSRPISFSPALETAAVTRSRPANGNITSDLGDESSFGHSRSIGGYADSPSKGLEKGYDESLPSLHSGPAIAKGAKVNKEDALLPLNYYTVPSLSELREWSHAELRSVESFVVGRKGYGSVEFVEPVDLTTVGELNNIPGGIVQLRKKECFVYPDEEDCFDPESGNERDGVQPGFDPKRVPGGGKASRGEGLNVPALVNLEGCWPLDRSNRQPIKDIEHPRVKQMVNKLRRRSDLEFKNYEPISGTWTFKVEHFSRYGLDGEDEDEEKEAVNQKNKSDGSKGKMIADKAKTIAEESQGKDDDEEMMNSSKDRLPRVSRSATPNVQQPASKIGTQPWAASLGLEARRMQVMQASFFGGATEELKEVTSPAKTIKSKVGRPASQSVEPQTNNIASRSTFDAPMRIDTQPSSKDAVKAVQEPNQSINIELAPPLAVRPRKFTKLAVEKSVADDGHEIVLDAGLAMGRSFRVGWGPHGTFVHRSRVIDSRSKNANDNQSESLSVVKMGKLQIFKPGEEKGESEKIIEMLKVQLQNSIIESDTDTYVQNEEEEEGSLPCPIAYPNPDLRFKHFLGSRNTSSTATTDQESLQKRFETAIFRLGSALFDEIDLKLSQDTDESLKMHALRMRRKHKLSEWIRWYVEHSIRSEIRTQIASPDRQSGEKIIFSLLSGGYFEEACKQALEIGNVRLATLLAQVNGGGNDDEYRLDVLDQLSIWRAAGADSFISTEYRKILEILSGNVLIGKGNGKRNETGERVEDIGISAGLDWVRTFALFLHYDAHFEDSIDESILSYESCIGKGLNDHLIAPPLPPYLEKEVKFGSKQFRDLVRDPDSYPNDILFALLKIYSQPDFPLEAALDPHQYGSSPLNFGIAFHVSQLLSRVLGVRDFGDRVDLGVEGEAIAKEFNWRGNSAAHDNLCIHFAMQLESMNYWIWAAFVLLHLEMPQSRKANIISLLSRNVNQFDEMSNNLFHTSQRSQTDVECSDDIKFITEKLQIPVEWIYEALANAAANKKERFMQFKLLLRAKLFSKAHSIAVIHLAPEGIIRHDFTLIMELFTPFRKNATKNIHGDEFEEEENQQESGDQVDVSGWQAGGQTFLDYIAICRSLPWLVGTHAANVINAMETIYPVDRTEEIDLRAALQDISSSFGSEIAEAVRKIDRIASRIPNLLQRIDELFDNFIGAKGDPTTIMVARKQMIQSVHNCIRSLKATKVLARLATFIPSLNVDLSVMVDQETLLNNSDGNTSSSRIEIENLHFMANAYCSAMVESNA